MATESPNTTQSPPAPQAPAAEAAPTKLYSFDTHEMNASDPALRLHTQFGTPSKKVMLPSFTKNKIHAASLIELEQQEGVEADAMLSAVRRVAETNDGEKTASNTTEAVHTAEVHTAEVHHPEAPPSLAEMASHERKAGHKHHSKKRTDAETRIHTSNSSSSHHSSAGSSHHSSGSGTNSTGGEPNSGGVRLQT